MTRSCSPGQSLATLMTREASSAAHQAAALRCQHRLANAGACAGLQRFSRMMDLTWITPRLALGGGIWIDANMAELVRHGVTHVIDMQTEFDDTPLAVPYGVQVLWNPADDDFQLKPPELFQRGVEFALAALDQSDARLYIHCAAGVHRAPMMTLAVLRAMGHSLADAADLLVARRPVVDLADVYVRSVENFIREYQPAGN